MAEESFQLATRLDLSIMKKVLDIRKYSVIVETGNSLFMEGREFEFHFLVKKNVTEILGRTKTYSTQKIKDTVEPEYQNIIKEYIECIRKAQK